MSNLTQSQLHSLKLDMRYKRNSNCHNNIINNIIIVIPGIIIISFSKKTIRIIIYNLHFQLLYCDLLVKMYINCMSIIVPVMFTLIPLMFTLIPVMFTLNM